MNKLYYYQFGDFFKVMMKLYLLKIEKMLKYFSRNLENVLMKLIMRYLI